MLYVKPLWDQHMAMGDLDRATPTKQLYWDDAIKTVGYVEGVLGRVAKYGKIDNINIKDYYTDQLFIRKNLIIN
jgi:rRNA processing protein Gar1